MFPLRRLSTKRGQSTQCGTKWSSGPLQSRRIHVCPGLAWTRVKGMTSAAIPSIGPRMMNASTVWVSSDDSLPSYTASNRFHAIGTPSSYSNTFTVMNRAGTSRSRKPITELSGMRFNNTCLCVPSPTKIERAGIGANAYVCTVPMGALSVASPYFSSMIMTWASLLPRISVAGRRRLDTLPGLHSASALSVGRQKE